MLVAEEEGCHSGLKNFFWLHAAVDPYSGLLFIGSRTQFGAVVECLAVGHIMKWRASFVWDVSCSQQSSMFVFLYTVQVFMQAFIPRKLDDVVDFERDLERVREGIDTDLVCG